MEIKTVYQPQLPPDALIQPVPVPAPPRFRQNEDFNHYINRLWGVIGVCNDQLEGLRQWKTDKSM